MMQMRISSQFVNRRVRGEVRNGRIHESPTVTEMSILNGSDSFLFDNSVVAAAPCVGSGWPSYPRSKQVDKGGNLSSTHGFSRITDLGGEGYEGEPYRSRPLSITQILERFQVDTGLPEGRVQELRSSRVVELEGISATGLHGLGGANDASCMERLLVHCAGALEMNDVTLAQQIMWVLNNFADPDGDTNQRVTSHFLKALVNRATKMGSSMFGRAPTPYVSKLLSPNELAGQVDVTPWYRFGYSAANGAMVGAFEGKDKVHIIDFSTTHCMQWPTLIEALSERSEGPPHIRLTVHDRNHRLPPLLSVSYDELGERLSKFARMKNVPFQFHVITQDAENLDASIFGLQAGEAVAVNCMLRLHYISDESSDMSCPRDRFLRMIRSLDPTIVTLVEEDSNLSLPSMVARLKAAFNYLWIPFDALDTFLPRDSSQRLQYEGDIGLRIDNVISCEGMDRIERLECKEKWVQRMKKAGFEGIQFAPDLVSQVHQMLHEHATGWGLKKEDNSLLLTWKGHNVVFASAWFPSCPISTPFYAHRIPASS